MDQQVGDRRDVAGGGMARDRRIAARSTGPGQMLIPKKIYSTIIENTKIRIMDPLIILIFITLY